MASSDDETESVPQFVSNYYFLDDKDDPVSFSILPLQWNEDEQLDSKHVQVFLKGDAGNSIEKIHKHVIGWKFDLSNVKPEVLVLTKERNWIRLLKPRKSFEDTIRSVLITVHCLHFVRRNPETHARDLWDHMSKVFSFYEVRPSQNDLVDHTSLIGEAVGKDAVLAKSKFLLTYLKEKPRKRKQLEEDSRAIERSIFIDDNIYEGDGEDDSNEEGDLFDSACAICDNGGDILCCEGKCLRAFHATEEAAAEDGAEADVTEDAYCFSLGLTQDEVDAMPVFFCKNCEYMQHQCFVCGKLGSSAKSSGAEVFQCANATCGHFYHPHCVAKLIHPDSETSAEEIEKTIAEGGSFTCPTHKCCVCKQKENKKVHELQFAVCRRCPKSYHRKCLPKEIPFEDEDRKDVMVRAWDDLLPNRILIYCLEHEIDKDFKTPVRNHIKFPDVEEKKGTFAKKKTVFKEKKEKQTTPLLADSKKIASKTNFFSREESHHKTARRQNEILSSPMKKDKEKLIKLASGLNTAKKIKLNDTSKREARPSVVKDNKPSLGERLFAYMNTGSEQGKQDTPDDDVNKTAVAKSTTISLSSALPLLDSDSERRMLNLISESTNAIKLEDIIKKHKIPSTHSSSSKYAVDKTITLGKVEGAIEACRTALQKLEEGCSTEDAEAVCEPEILGQIIKWKNKLRVYLAPFLYGMRYTSFGRHFTKVDKLEEIVSKLHWYVKGGDMIVDFCCGANDFSVLMKKKLEETGKRCLYKNYDFIQPKNDFNFEKRDWMTVKPEELPNGSRLIMGLNPPFGVNGALANKFIDKALKFKPKLLLLIVPVETERLDEKNSPYDLVWEEDQFLSGKSFYLPGSVDINDKQMEQWNVRAPLLYLWSRPDWSSEHKEIAKKQGHVSKLQEDMPKNHSETPIPDHPMTVSDHCDDGSMLVDDSPVQTKDPGGSSSEAIEDEGHLDGSSKVSGDAESHDLGKNQSGKKSRKQRYLKQKHSSSRDKIPTDNNLDSRRPSATEMHNSSPHVPFGADYDGIPANNSDDRWRTYETNSDDQYLTGTNRWHSGASPVSVYGVRNFEEQLTGRMRENVERLGHRPYITETEEMIRRESDIRSQIRFHGQYNPEFVSTQYLAGSDSRYGQIGSSAPPLSVYGHSVPVPEASYRMNILATRQYVPQLDELNHPRSVLRPEAPGFSGNGMFGPRLPPPEFEGGPTAFARGPHQSYAHHSSAGWID